MKELNRTDRLTIASIIFALILVIGLVTLKQPEVPYLLGINETTAIVSTADESISPEETASILKNNDARYMLADLRNPVDFQKSHIGNAVNIPIQEILQKKHLDHFRELSEDGITVLLYGNDETETNGAWMMLRQTGINNVSTMQGGYQSYKMYQARSLVNNEASATDPEKPGYNYREIMSKTGANPAPARDMPAEPVKVIKREKKSAAEGGC
jgi:rhodanese-related sulfurtransferase